MKLSLQINGEPVKKRHVRKSSIMFSIIVLFIVLSLTAVVGYANRKPPGNGTLTTENGNIVVEEKLSAPWWNSDYSFYKRIVVLNNDIEKPIVNGQWLTFNINHKKLVEDGNSNEDGSDFKMVYFSKNNYIDVPFIVENANQENTQIIFKTQAEIAKDDKDRGYFLYFGNEFASKLEQKSNDYVPENNVDNYRIIESNYVKNPVFLTRNRKWILIGTDQFKDYSKLELGLEVSDTIEAQELPAYKIQKANLNGDFLKIQNGQYSATPSLDKIEPGDYTVQASIKTKDGKTVFSPPRLIKVTYPLYVAWTMDWEGYDTSNQTIKLIDEFSDKYKLPITHFWNPRINLAVSKDRLKYLLDWIKSRQANKGDEIGMHLHMHLDMVKAAGVEKVLTKPHWDATRNNGSDVPTTAYPLEDYKKILAWGLQKFTENGLAKPLSYRAGGWYANLDILKILAENGFLIDSSGRTKYSFGKDVLPPTATVSEGTVIPAPISSPVTEEGELPYQLEYKVEGFWDLPDTVKPYNISANDQNSSTAPNINLWEFANNGADSWHYNGKELTKRFDDNYQGGTLNDPRMVTYLTHPHSVQVDIPRLEEAFSHINTYVASEDKGPVVFVTLINAYGDFEKK